MINKFKKKYVVLSVLFVLIISFFFINKFYEKNKIIPDEKEKTIFIVSDTHLFSNNLLSAENEKYIKENFSSDGRIQEYDYKLIRLLIDEVNEQKPDYLVITGDLSYNGEKDSHVEFAKLLNEIEDTQVLVIPGNHDMYSLNTVSTNNDIETPTENINSNEFKKIYANMGYKDAYSYDENSLSYIYEISDDQWLLMIDTT